jgi:NAD-dependent deacetylase
MNPSKPDSTLQTLLHEAEAILVFTGAGISTSSGIPDYRGPRGVWKKRKPVYYQDFMSSEEARLEYWDFQLEGWDGFKNAKPNAAHQACVTLEENGKLLMLVTQNIDGLHSLAGTSPQRLVEVHGTNRVVECQSCHDRSDPEAHFEFFRKNQKSPRCKCGGLLKPATISFGQQLKSEDLDRATRAAAGADLVVSLGSTLSVYPAAAIPLSAAERGVPYVIINRGATEHDNHPSVKLRLEGDVASLLPPAVEAACRQSA